MQQETSFGAFLDPVADKLMVVVVIVLLVQKHPSIFVALPSVVIVAREISISALREWMAQIEPLAGLPIFQIGLVTFYIAAILTLVSMANYLRAAWPVITRHG